MANCYACKAEIVFDNEHVGRNGKKIPLDPATKQPHDCPMREKTSDRFVERFADDIKNHPLLKEEKNDHGNEISYNTFHNVMTGATDAIKSEYVDHTLKGQSKVKIFFGNFAPDVEEEYNEFLRLNKIKTQGAQFQISNTDDQSMLFAIALYYEEVKA